MIEENKKILIRGIILVLLLCILLFTISEVSRYATPGKLLKKVKALNTIERNTIDIVFFGNSHILTGIDIELVEDLTGLDVINMAAASEQIPEAVLLLEEVLRTQRPDVVVLGAFTFLLDSKKNYTANSIPFSLRKIKYILNIRKINRTKGILFPILQFHNIWSNKKDMDLFINQLTSKPDISEIKSTFKYTSLSEEVVNEYMVADEVKKFTDIDYKQEYEYLRLLKKICDKYNIQLLIVMAPWYEGYVNRIDYDEIHKNIKYGAEKFGIPYYDLNKIQDIKWSSKYYKDEKFGKNQHTNYYGAYTATSLIIEWMAQLDDNNIDIGENTKNILKESERYLDKYLATIDSDMSLLVVDSSRNKMNSDVRTDAVNIQLERLGLSEATSKVTSAPVITFSNNNGNISKEIKDDKGKWIIEEGVSGISEEITLKYTDSGKKIYVRLGDTKINCEPECTNIFIINPSGYLENMALIRWDICNIIVDSDL